MDRRRGFAPCFAGRTRVNRRGIRRQAGVARANDSRAGDAGRPAHGVAALDRTATKASEFAGHAAGRSVRRRGACETDRRFSMTGGRSSEALDRPRNVALFRRAAPAIVRDRKGGHGGAQGAFRRNGLFGNDLDRQIGRRDDGHVAPCARSSEAPFWCSPAKMSCWARQRDYRSLFAAGRTKGPPADRLLSR